MTDQIKRKLRPNHEIDLCQWCMDLILIPIHSKSKNNYCDKCSGGVVV